MPPPFPIIPPSRSPVSGFFLPKKKSTSLLMKPATVRNTGMALFNIKSPTSFIAGHTNSFVKFHNPITHFTTSLRGKKRTPTPNNNFPQCFFKKPNVLLSTIAFFIPSKILFCSSWCFSRSFFLFSAQASSSIFSSADKLLWPKNASAVVLVFFSMAVNLSNIPSDPSLPIVSKISSLGSALVAPSGTLGSEKGTILFESNVA